jgi:metal-dependent HD superfamily phosphatase/phosphodiesterase
MSNSLRLPVRGNEKLEKLMLFIDEDTEIKTLWKCSNIIAVDRLGYNDHGPIHIKIVANRALKILRMLITHGIQPSIVNDYGLTTDDAEVVVVLASIMHDLGLSIVRERHEVYSVPIAKDILRRCLPLVYGPENETIVRSEVLHAVLSHHETSMPLTLEAGIVKVADALDMESGRARIPFEAGRVNIHSVSAYSIQKVDILEGEEKPIILQIKMENPSGIFQVDNLLGAKVKGSGLEKYVRVEMIIGKDEQRIIADYE